MAGTHAALPIKEPMQEPDFCKLLCEISVAALRSAASDDAKAAISNAISRLARDEVGRRALVAAGAYKAAADALRSAASDDPKATISLAKISNAILNLCVDQDGRRALIAAGAYKAAADALKSAASDDAKADISKAISRLAGDDDVPRSLSSAP